MAFFGAKPRQQQPADPANGQPKQGPGAQLIQARERWGMTREQVASTLRLPDHVIAALEQDHYRNLPPPAYVKGYISGYARLVGLNAADLVTACEIRGCGDPALAAKRSPSLCKGRGETLLRRASFAVLAAFLGSAMLYWADNKDRSSAPPLAVLDKPADKTTPPAANPHANDTIEPTPASPENTRHHDLPNHAKVARSSPPKPTPATADSVIGTATAATVSSNASEAPARDQTVEKATLELKFSADSWLAVRDAAGKRLAWETVKAGSTRQLQGIPPLKVVLGNVEAVRISVQGEPFDPTPFTIGRMARFSVE